MFLLSRRLSSTAGDLNARMKQLNSSKQFQNAIDLFETHVQQQAPTSSAINQALKSCIELSDVKQGLDIHRRFLSQSKNNPFIQTTLMRLYLKAGDLSGAQKTFASTKNKALIMYNTMLDGLSNNDRPNDALKLFQQIPMQPNEYTFSILFKICAQLGDRESITFGKNVLQTLPVSSENNTIVFNSAIHMLLQGGEVSMAEQIFSRMKKDSTSYGAMMAGYLKNNRAQEAIDLFFNIDKSNPVNVLLFFKACTQLGNQKALSLGKQVFSRLSLDSLDHSARDKILPAVFNMFIKCSDMEGAEKLFSRLNRDVFAYGSLMTMYNSADQPEKTLALFKRMQREKIQANDFIFVAIINAYFQLNDFLKAQEFFVEIPNKSSMIYDVMLNRLANSNRPNDALKLFQQIPMQPNEYTFSILFKICAQLGDQESITFGKNVLQTLPVSSENNTIVFNSAIHMLLQGGEVSMAEQVFSRMKKDSTSYGAMMVGYLKNNRAQEAIDLFFKMNKPDEVNFLLVFNACAQLGSQKAVSLGRQVFSRLSVDHITSNKILLAVFNMFIKCSDMENAEKLFTQLNRNVVAYGSLMAMHNRKNEPEKTLALFERMNRQKIEADSVILVLVINALSLLSDLSRCESVISGIPEHLLDNIQIRNALIDMWGKAGSVENAKRIFDQIPTPDVLSFSSMINVCGLNGMGVEAVQLFRQIPQEMNDEILYICALNACSHSGLIEEAREIFEKIPREERTEKVYTTMIDTLSRRNLVEEAQELISEFEQYHPHCFSMYLSVLSSARNQRNPTLAQTIVDRIQPYFTDHECYTASSTVPLLNTYTCNEDPSTAIAIPKKMNKPVILGQ